MKLFESKAFDAQSFKKKIDEIYLFDINNQKSKESNRSENIKLKRSSIIADLSSSCKYLRYKTNINISIQKSLIDYKLTNNSKNLTKTYYNSRCLTDKLIPKDINTEDIFLYKGKTINMEKYNLNYFHTSKNLSHKNERTMLKITNSKQIKQKKNYYSLENIRI